MEIYVTQLVLFLLLFARITSLIVVVLVAKNGWAGRAIPATDSTPPFSNRRARDCTAGVCKTRSNKSPVTGT